MENKQTAEINTIHHMTAAELATEAATLAAELRGHLTIEARSHKTNRLQLVNRYLEIRTAAAALGRLGGSVKSDKKSKSSAANGALGGRPRKTPANT